MMPSMSKAEYEQKVLQDVREVLLGQQRRGGTPTEGSLQQRITVEEVRLDAFSAGPGMIVVLYRDRRRPECLFGWQREASEPTEAEESFIPDPEIQATVVLANFEEHIIGSPRGLPEDCSPGDVNWTHL